MNMITRWRASASPLVHSPSHYNNHEFHWLPSKAISGVYVGYTKRRGALVFGGQRAVGTRGRSDANRRALRRPVPPHSLSLLNHACRPNCVAVFEGTRLVLRAVQDVSPGEEVS